MREKIVAPTHPGGIIKRMYLEPLGMTNTALAEALGVSRKTVSKIVNERGASIQTWRFAYPGPSRPPMTFG